ncbi:hypothetical protein C463_05710 [Halorubrum californiense DSM 19288]|uniref:Uncharacterized protein n=1 Tax=Halorubrum californiense DSM 19288 TaxID=1227465 RepID=M0EG88_9EURY|nr:MULTISPECIES: hypothetical protein [Halorubrum]ELZ45902.1 hypothetical protein C463_05710 [Halorubrum californiense DSM 19288]TKX72326.1 hypothetical protein EXE40_04685 [Halorubrum sp. GN11GM_10-3_MGM]
MTDPRSGADRGDDRRDGGETHRHSRRASRRGVLAVGAAGLLAGCLVTSEEEDGADARQTGDGAGGDESDADGGDGTGSDGDGGSGDDSGSDGDDESTPDEVGPDGSGLVVTDATVLDVSDGGSRTTVRARLTVENAGRFEYGTVEFRVDAYATPAGSDEREAVGFEYDTERFTGDDRFGGSQTRRFTVEITFPSRRSSVRPESDRYAVDAAVRRAEPI